MKEGWLVGSSWGVGQWLWLMLNIEFEIVGMTLL